MKLLWKACVCSLIIHALFLAIMMTIDYVQTKNYKSSLASYENIEYLQSEVAFGYVLSPVYAVLSFLLVTIISSGVIFLYRKVFKLS